MNNRDEYLTQLTNAGIELETANLVADAAVATDQGQERTPSNSKPVLMP